MSNSLGTAVGARAIALRPAIIMAGLVEFLGSVLLGGNVSQTISSGIVDPNVFAGGDEISFVLGMFTALLSAAIWLVIATYAKLPVSGTHSLIGAVIGFAMVSRGPSSVPSSNVTRVVVPMVTSPLLGAAVAFAMYSAITRIFMAPPPPRAEDGSQDDMSDEMRRESRALVYLPFLYFGVVFILAFLSLMDDAFGFSTQGAVVSAAMIGGIGAAMVDYYAVPMYEVRFGHMPADDGSVSAQSPAEDGLESGARVRTRSDEGNAGTPSKPGAGGPSAKGIHSPLESLFVPLLILTAAYVGFGHGANDISNSVGPLAAIFSVSASGSVESLGSPPLWIMLMGGLGIVVGLSIWGAPVMKTVGESITRLTPSKGFAAQFATASTVLSASLFGAPVSTTHVLIGAITGIGVASSGSKAIDLGTLKKIGLSWIITFPAGAGIAATIFSILSPFFVAADGVALAAIE